MSVVIPCRREVDVIAGVLASVIATDYPHDRLEVLVVDGMSDDGTRAIVGEVAAGQPLVRLLDNPKRVIPAALNIGIALARGEIIVRMDAHTRYPPEYIRRCVEGLLATGADNVGGPCLTLPREQTLAAQAFATVLSHPFGVGNALYKLGISKPIEVDAVPFGCMWRKRMLEIGPYDERIARSEDFGFNIRLRARGGRLVLLPDITSYYYARSPTGAVPRAYVVERVLGLVSTRLRRLPGLLAPLRSPGLCARTDRACTAGHLVAAGSLGGRRGPGRLRDRSAAGECPRRPAGAQAGPGGRAAAGILPAACRVRGRHRVGTHLCGVVSPEAESHSLETRRSRHGRLKSSTACRRSNTRS